MKIIEGVLGRKYAIYFVSVVGAALVTMGLVQLAFTYRENQAAVLSLQQEKAAFAASRIEAYVREIERQLGWMRFPRPEGAQPEQIRIDFLKLLRQVPAITDVAYVETGGRELVKVSRVAVDVVGSGTDYSRHPAFTHPRKGETWFGPVEFRKGTEPYMTMAIAQMGGGGTVFADVNLKFIWELISRIRAGDKGGAYVVDAEGRLLAHPDITFVLRKQDLSNLPQVAAARSGAAAAPGVAIGPAGTQVLSAHADIPALNWHVFVEQPVAEALGPVYAAVRRTAVLLLLGLVLAVLFSVYVARRMVRPIMAIGQGATVLADGNLSHRIDVQTGDELQGLADRVNHLAANLQDLTGNLERKVDQRTRELSESLRYQTAVADVLRRMSEFPADAEPVLREIMQSACRLLGSEAAAVFTLQDDKAHLAATLGWTEAALAASRRLFPAAPGAARLRPLLRTGGWRQVVAVPLRREGVTIGAIALGWSSRRAESQHDEGVLRTFADQAVIALESIRLVGEIRRKSAELELAGKHKSEFLASMSHELRTPLNAIIGFSEALLERMFGELGDKQADYLTDIHSSGTHLLSLINDILDLSKIEAGRMDLELSAFSVPTTLQGTMSLMRERASRGEVALQLSCGSSVGDWIADERKFRQILLNLMSNAIKFTPAGGQVSVEAQADAGQLQVAVRDTGIGIRAEDREVVFEEFRQGSGNHLAKMEGTGLGLALTRRLVELHGGTITLQSEPGRGSTFVVRLPAREMA